METDRYRGRVTVGTMLRRASDNARYPRSVRTADTASAAPDSRERILEAATRLFYGNGILATGVYELVQVAGVSKRTLYQLFGDKDGLIVAYLERMASMNLIGEHNLANPQLDPRSRLLGLFEAPASPEDFRGCPFHNAAVELSRAEHPARKVVTAQKEGVRTRLEEVAAQAGARDAHQLAGQLATLYEGAMALSSTLRDPSPYDSARVAATVLLDQSR